MVTGSNPAEVKGLLTSRIFDDDPCIFIETMPLYWTKGPSPEPACESLWGRRTLRQRALTSPSSHGRPVAQVLAIAEKLSSEGIEVEVVDLRTVSPLDKVTVLESVAKTGRAVVATRPLSNSASVQRFLR